MRRTTRPTRADRADECAGSHLRQPPPPWWRRRGSGSGYTAPPVAAVVRPRILRFELCSSCGAVVWRCRLRREGTVAIDPRPLFDGPYLVTASGVLRWHDGGPPVARYTLHVAV